MLVCETAGIEERDLADLAVLLSQLDAIGIRAVVHARSIPPDLGRNTRFDLAPHVFDGPLPPNAPLLLAGAHRLNDERLAHLRRLSGPDARACLGMGRFARRQDRLGAAAKLSYVLQREPELFDLPEPQSDEPHADEGFPVFGAARPGSSADAPRLLVIGPDLEDRSQVSALDALALSARIRVAVLTSGQAKTVWLGQRGPSLAIFHYSEILPWNLADRVDVCVSFAAPRGNYRAQCLFADLAASSVALIDGTVGHEIAATNDAFVRGPTDLVPLARFLTDEILPNRAALGAAARRSQTAAAQAPARLTRAIARLGAGPTAQPAPARPPGRAVVFMPTNGVGLGHAQRCVLVAGEMTTPREQISFAAFPSCTRLVKAYGYDAMPLIARSARHREPHENDLVNYLRLRALTAGSTTLVFDGGYVFDFVYRTILDHRLRAVWIRRGLWQSHQDNTVALDREKVFDRVIVPRDAFDELNVDYSSGPRVAHVGPVVRQLDLGSKDRAALRAELADRYGIAFERLVVSFLGGGVAADRGAQTQALCGMMERRTDVLHLVIVWPSAVIQPAWFQWTQSRVVKTHHASALAAAADLCVSAAGYNSFHEALYNRIPTVFVPQTGSFMDDQEARARAAVERGLAGMVEANEMMRLEREVARLLDGAGAEEMRAALASAELPETGAAAAARLIEEECDANPALEHGPVAHRPAGRR